MAAGLRMSTFGCVGLAPADFFLDDRLLSLFFLGLSVRDLDFLVLVGYNSRNGE